MKKIILFCLILYIETFAQTISSVELKKIYCDWNGPVAFWDSVETVIKDYYGNVIAPSNNFYYEYHVINDDLVHPPAEEILGGPGENRATEDNDYNFIQTWYVIVKETVSQTILGTSNTVIFQMETEPNRAKPVYFSALRSNGGNEAGVHKDHWMYVVDLWHFNDLSYPSHLTQDYVETLRSSPFFLTNNNDKFHYWNDDQSLVINHKSFNYIGLEPENLIAHYNTAYGGVTIQSNTDSFPWDSIEFKDPWLVDYDDQPYGMRNQGMNAPFKKVSSPFNPSLGSQYNGVLLHQPYTGNNPVYYSINIPSSINPPQHGGTHKIYLQSWDWDTTCARLRHPDSLTTGVVFTSSGGVTITANYKAQGLSNDVYAYSSNNQGKFIRTADGNLHNVYESMGHVWYEMSTDNGQNWLLQNNHQPLDDGGGENPSIDWVNINGTHHILLLFSSRMNQALVLVIQFKPLYLEEMSLIPGLIRRLHIQHLFISKHIVRQLL